ncbi:MAG TPA: hypothetical protein DCS91_06095 [Microcoleaceae bacterium UBA11344]|nr:hypothetical protein [Microcoleaceae cyanobacterium UBA11344]
MAGKFAKTIVAIFSLIAIGSVGTYLYSDGYLGVDSKPLDNAKLIPSDALVGGTIDLNPESWSKLQKFGTPEARQLFEQAWKELEKEFAKESPQINYDRDIKPWLGTVVWAALPSAKTQEQQSPTPEVIWVITIKNKLSMWQLNQNLSKINPDEKFKEIDYKGFKILESTTNKGDQSYCAIVKRYLVCSDKEQNVQKSIEIYKGQPSLASKPEVAKVLSSDLKIDKPVAQFYIFDSLALIKESVANAPQAQNAPLLDRAELYPIKSLSGGIGIDDAGIRINTVANLQPNATTQTNFQPATEKIINYFTQQTVALFTGKGINNNWSNFVSQTQNIPEISQGINQFRGNLATLNLDLDKDIFGWMDGEYGFGVISLQDVPLESAIGVKIVIQTSNPEAAKSTFAKLNVLAKGNGISISEKQIADRAITEWQAPSQDFVLGQGWLDANSVFVTLANAKTLPAIAATSNPTLAQSENFQTITSSLPKPNSGYGYFNFEQILTLVNSAASKNFIESSVPKENIAEFDRPIGALNSVLGIAMTTVEVDKSTQRYEMLIALKPATAGASPQTPSANLPATSPPAVSPPAVSPTTPPTNLPANPTVTTRPIPKKTNPPTNLPANPTVKVPPTTSKTTPPKNSPATPTVTPPATPTNPDNDFRQAVNQATRAASLTQTATTKQQWQQVIVAWEQAITGMKKIPANSPKYKISQPKIVEYQNNLKYAKIAVDRSQE